MQGEARRGNSAPRGGPHREQIRKQLKTLSKNTFGALTNDLIIIVYEHRFLFIEKLQYFNNQFVYQET